MSFILLDNSHCCQNSVVNVGSLKSLAVTKGMNDTGTVGMTNKNTDQNKLIIGQFIMVMNECAYIVSPDKAYSGCDQLSKLMRFWFLSHRVPA